MTTIRPTEDEYLTVPAFAAITGKSVQTIYNDISALKERNRRAALGLPVTGKGPDLPPLYKFDKRVMLRKSEVDEWILARRLQAQHVTRPKDSVSAGLHA